MQLRRMGNIDERTYATIRYWIFTFIGLILYFLLLTRTIYKFCIDFKQKINPWIFTFITSDLLIHTNIVFCGIFLLSNIEWDSFKSPGLTRNMLIKNLFYKLIEILMRSLFYTILVYLASIIVFIPNITFQMTWGTVIKTFAKSYNFSPIYVSFFAMPISMIELYEPIVANYVSGLLLALYLVFLGWILGVVNIVTHSTWLGGVTAILITLFDLDVNNNLASAFYWLSPSSLSRLTLLHVLDEPKNDALSYAIKILIALTFTLICILYMFNRLIKNKGGKYEKDC